MPNTALQIENVSKLYKLGVISTGTISHDLNRWWHRIRGLDDPYQMVAESNVPHSRASADYVWALRDVSFEVGHGEAIGIIGRNGAGKSTLLKILSRVTSLTKGEIRINGRIASLLEVGTGFHPELTGRENIFLNGAILGMKKHEIRSKLDEIIAFSGVERYVDTPVKRYSSGMRVRLAFAVAAHLEPEILIVDEVLAVGDAEFQKKAIGKMQDVSKGEGRTVLFVSHNMGAVTQLCTRAALLENGNLILQDEVENVISKYLEGQNSKSFFLREESDEKGKDAFFKEIRITDQNGKDKTDFLVEEAIYIRFFIKINRNRDRYDLFCMILEKRLNRVFSAESDVIHEEMSLKIEPYFLTRGTYSIHAIINIPRSQQEQEDVVENVCHFNIIDNKSRMAKHGSYDYGSVFGNFQWIYE